MNVPVAQSATVRFSGLPGAGAPMTWSQFGMWGAIKKFRPHDTYLNVEFPVAVPPGCTVDDVLAVIRDVVVRHEALRTLYYDTAQGEARQEVLGDGEIEVELTSGTEESLGEVVGELAGRSFDVGRELPARFCVVLAEGRPAWLAIVVSHLSIDGIARNRLIEEFTARLGGDRRFGEADEVLTPVARAREENGPDGERRNARTIGRWRRFLERVDVANFPERLRDGRTPRWVRIEMTSPALGAAAERIAERNDVTTPAVYVALSATVVSALAGRETSALRCMISNRFTAPEKRYIGNLSQACAFDVHVGDAPFDDVVARAKVASIRGYSMGRYRTEQMEALVDPARFDAMHNDFRDVEAGAATTPRSDAEIESLRARTSFAPPEGLDYYDDKFHVEVRSGSGGPAPAVMIDRCHIPVDSPRPILLAMEAFALAVLTEDRGRPAVDTYARVLAQAARTEGEPS